MKKLLFFFLLPLSLISQNIGDFHQGGVVFYIDNSSGVNKGLILDMNYLQAASPWNTQDSLVSDWGQWLHYCPGVVDTNIGGGEVNTNLFVADHPNQFYAANICFNSNSGGYSDWFLPSVNELWQAMLNIAILDSVMILNGGDEISSNFHWSSTQTLVDSTGGDLRYAYGIWPHTTTLNGIPNGPVISIKQKNMPYLVRAVRCIDGDCSFSSNLSHVQEYTTEKKLISIVDALGRQIISSRPGQTLFYIYHNGLVEKKFFTH